MKNFSFVCLYAKHKKDSVSFMRKQISKGGKGPQVLPFAYTFKRSYCNEAEAGINGKSRDLSANLSIKRRPHPSSSAPAATTMRN